MLSYLKQKYWSHSRQRAQRQRLLQPANNDFRHCVNHQQQQLYGRLANAALTDNDQHLAAAVAWILRAQAATEDDGVSLGYFPLSEHQGWFPSYPETTGYIITSLIAYAQANDRNDILSAALRMADWEIAVQMDSGAVQGGPVCAPQKQTPAAFNTGMVLDGWMSAHAVTGRTTYLDAGLKAALFLTNDLDEDGYFRTNGDFVSQGEPKTYSCLCAWAMYRAGQVAGREDIKAAAVNSIEAALKQQNALGWFAHNCLTHSKEPLTHTIAYALQGILEVGVLAGRDDFIAAAAKGAAGAVKAQHNNGFLSACLDSHWQPRRNYVCLTGSAQLAIVCFRLVQVTGSDELLPYGDKLLAFVKASQLLSANNPAMEGAIAGSFPIMGQYMTAGYPNWATKYFIDALMLQQQLRAGDIGPP